MEASTRADRPDSARSWVIAGAAFVISLMLSGISRTSGLFYVALIDKYSSTRMQANTPFTLRNIVRNLLGPLVGILGHRYGVREVTMAGGIFAGLGVGLCAFAPDIRWIAFFWGGIHGLGVALGNTLFQVVVNQYFEKHRVTAAGFAFSGACVGSFIFPVMIDYMLNHIGLPGTFLIIGALMLHVIPAGMLMKEPPWITTARRKKLSNFNAAQKDPEKRPSKPSFTLRNLLLPKLENNNKQKDIFIISFKRIPSYYDRSYQHTVQNETRFQDKEAGLNGKVQKSEQNSKSLSPPSDAIPVSIYEGIIQLCCNPLFYMISLSFIASAVLFDLYLSTIVDYMTDKGAPEDTRKYFISVISVGDLVGRLCFGWITDKRYVSMLKFMALLHTIQALTFIALTFFSSLQSSMAFVVVCGLAGGANVVMYPSLLAKYLPSVQSLAVGSISFVGGIMEFGVPPMIGYFRDEIGSYNGLYFIIGGLSCVTGTLWLMEPMWLKLQKKISTWRES